MAKIVFRVGLGGVVKAEGVGFVGDLCQTKIQPDLEAIGSVDSITKKPEYDEIPYEGVTEEQGWE
jgi:hypothetical protein